MNYPSTRFVFDRKHTATSKVKALVQVEIIHGRKKKYVSTGVRVYKNQFDEKKRICCNTFDMTALNAKMNAVKRRIDNFISATIEAGNTFTLEGLQRFLDESKAKEIPFVDFVEKRITERKDIRDSTRKVQMKLVSVLREFQKIKYFSDLTKSNILEFDDFLHKRNIRQTTLYTYHKVLKIYIHDAIRREIISCDPYLSLSFKRGESEEGRYLTIEEFELLKNAQMPTKSIDNVRDLFVLQCLTGLAYSDLMAFDFSKVEKEEKMLFISGNRKKTGISFCAALLPDAIKIINKHDGRLPKMSNQQYNLRLKIVADAAGIDKPIASHWGRRTCGMLLLNKGVGIEVVAKVLGHSSIKTTESVYAKILNRTAVKEMFEKMT